MTDLIGRNDNLTTIDRYIPTPRQLSLLQALVNPENARKNITDICKAVDPPASRQFYYDSMKDADFVEMYHKLCMDMVKEKVAPVLHSVYNSAIRGSFPHAKLWLELAGMITDKELSGNVIMIKID